jgi:signal transduction histidine kinase
VSDDTAKILIIDDEEIVLDSCTEILEGSPYRLATASNGTEGLRLLHDFQPDLVMLDLKMPGMSGFEVLEEIQKSQPTVVTIVITGYATVGSAVEAMKKGAYDFLPKPFTPEEFRLIIRRGVEKRTLLLETIALKREREVLREHFASIVSHELKAPLGAIQQNIFGLERELAEVLSEDQARRCDRIKTRIGDLLNLINTWRRGATVDIGTIKENFGPVSIDVPIAKAVESVVPHATRKAVDITTAVPQPPGVVWGDEGTLTQTLVNVIGNAVKYSQCDTSVAVVADQPNGEVTISVTDTGVGIAEDDLPFIFDTFYRARSGEGTESGSGLGLAVSRRVVRAHGGGIEVRSTVGKGSTFIITLPAYEGDLPEPAAAAGTTKSSEEGPG